MHRWGRSGSHFGEPLSARLGCLAEPSSQATLQKEKYTIENNNHTHMNLQHEKLRGGTCIFNGIG